MKLILAIVSDEDAGKVSGELSKNNFSVTKLATTGGFLKAGNTTMLIGTEDEKVQQVIDIIESKSKRRKQITVSGMHIQEQAAGAYPIEVEVGGATIFVLNIDRFEKV